MCIRDRRRGACGCGNYDTVGVIIVDLLPVTRNIKLNELYLLASCDYYVVKAAIEQIGRAHV